MIEDNVFAVSWREAGQSSNCTFLFFVRTGIDRGYWIMQDIRAGWAHDRWYEVPR